MTFNRDQPMKMLASRSGYTDSVRCPVCGLISWHPIDVSEGYCAHCAGWTSPALNKGERTAPVDIYGVRMVATLALMEQAGDRESVTWGPYTAYLVVGALQTAARHPGMTPGMVRMMVHAGRTLTGLFDREAARIIERGWDPNHDAPPVEPTMHGPTST